METKQVREPALEEAPKLYAIVVGGPNGEMAPDLAAAMEDVHQANLGNPDNFYNNPRKHREALEGMGRLLAEWQEENGAFTEEELEAAWLSLYGERPSSSMPERSSSAASAERPVGGRDRMGSEYA